MNKFPLVISIAALALAAMAFFKSRTTGNNQPAVAENKNTGVGNFKIAYFDIDTLQEQYTYFKDVSGDIKKKEEIINNELAGIERGYQQKMSVWQQKGAQMTQTEMQQAQKEAGQMQQNYQSRKMTLEQELTDMRNKKLRDIQIKIEDYLKEYNKQKEYAYIFSYEPALFIYYKDSAYNITPELLKGLNEEYGKNKGK